MAKDSTISLGFTIVEGPNGMKSLIMKTADLRKIMESTVEVAKKFESKFINFAAFSTSVNAVSNAVGQLNATFSSVTGQYESFNQAMKAANTMAGKDSAGFKRMKSEVAALSKEIPILRDQLADGLYQVISNGVPEDNWIEYLRASARSAVGGMADINKVVGVTATVIKNYGMEWSAAQDIQDKIQLTAKNGVTSFEQLAQALPRVTGNAATLGVTIDELLGTFATLTGVSGNTAEVSTQLAAVFTALVKPSKEASDMAANMGMQFNAAAIKSAGGFEEFLKKLDESVKAYAAANGVLEQEVYAKLFGSAEALRALIPLQGELAETFAKNVDAMTDSAGTMDAAFADMAGTGSAVAQMLKNKWAALMDKFAGFVSVFQPYVSFFSEAIEGASSLFLLAKAFRETYVAQMLSAVGSKTAAAAMTALGLKGKSATFLIRVFSTSLRSSTRAMIAFKVAMRGLMIASGIGLVIWAVTAAVEALCNATDKAAEKTERLIDAKERARREDEFSTQVQEKEKTARESALASIELSIAKLKAFSGTREDEIKLVKEMNSAYGTTMGYFSTVSDWYEALIKNSEAYCRQMEIEATTRLLADRIAKLNIEKNDIINDEYGNKRKYSTKKEEIIKSVSFSTNTGTYSRQVHTGEYEDSDLDKANAAVKDINAKIAGLRKQVQDNIKEAQGLSFAVTGTVKPPKLDDGPDTGSKPAVFRATAEILKEIEENIKYFQAKLQDVTGAEAAEINKQIALWQKKADAIKNAGADFNPLARTQEQIAGNIRALESLLADATERERAQLSRQIEFWRKKDDAIRRTGYTLDDVAKRSQSISEAAIGNLDYRGSNAPDKDREDIKRQTELWRSLFAAQEAVKKNVPSPVAVKPEGLMPTDNVVALADRWAKLRGEAVDTKEAIAGAVGSIGQSLSSLGQSFEMPVLNIVGIMAQAIATMIQGYAVATSEASAKLGPWGWIAFAATGLAQLTAMVSTVKGLPAFADGGIVSGPTLALVGEYGGASGNPEVIAPLDKLRSMIEPSPAAMLGDIKFRLEGRTLVAAIEKEANITRRSR